MPDWKKAVRDVMVAIEEAGRRVQAEHTSSQRAVPLRNICLFWDCGKPIRSDHILCYEHYQDLQDGLLDECPGCNRAKDVQYELCLECYREQQSTRRRTVKPSPGLRWYRPEYSKAWEMKDAEADHFFVYVLRLSDGTFYAGQTRELRERLSEHRDGRVQSTAGRAPRLIWFTTVPTRDAATSMEAKLKQVVHSNPREIRRMMVWFRDLVRELDYT